jgi:segregation and condensation protein A
MREAAGPPATEVIYDDTPIHVYMQRIHHALADRERVELIDLVEPGQHKSAYIGWFLAMLELTRHHGAAVAENENGDIMVVRTESYQAELNVNEVDNYASGAINNSNMPIRMR